MLLLYSKKSKKSTINAKKIKKGVKEWHYFINSVETDKGQYDIIVNVRDKGTNQYVYEVAFKKKNT